VNGTINDQNLVELTDTWFPNPVYGDMDYEMRFTKYKNFGGVLITWDKLFKTYQPETEKVNYGLTTGSMGYNPFKLVFKGFTDLFTGK